jgi:hypothetical protein
MMGTWFGRICICVAAAAAASATAAEPLTKKAEQQLLKTQAECRKGTVDSLHPPALAQYYIADMPFTETGGVLQACTALEQPDRCAALNMPPDDYDNCIRFKALIAAIHGIFKGSDPAAACRKYISWKGTKKSRRLREEDEARVCAVVVRVLREDRRYDAFCEQILALGLEPSTKESLARCKDLTVFLKGRPKLCDSVFTAEAPADTRPIDLRGYCRTMAGLVGALRFDRPAACSADPLCRAALSGKPPDCAPYRKDYDRLYCRRVDEELSKPRAAPRKP